MEKKAKSQILFFIITALIQTLILAVFLIIYFKIKMIPIILGGAIILVWSVATLKIVSAKMAIKDINKNKDEEK